ncbi:MAG TPA: sn-glycerol-3-phosphate ABC transporter ATP-binding protein UgpC [Burkholderiaceae bacterium]|nr:sn-glycerol-3-phosphate ABC transporter ATP-binding protein UgpC [Burkholderiaceae bacterium]
MAALSIRGARKSFGNVPVLHGVDLEVADGEFAVFVGPSGCGKTTLLRLIAGLEDLSGGAIAIGGEVVNDTPAAQRGVAMVFQSYALYPHMTVAENMSFALRMSGQPREAIQRAVGRAAEILQINALLDRKPAALSGGQRQRVAIGRAIVREPKVFLFDEPLSNLDASLRVQMRIELGRLHKQLGTTMVYVTHDQVEAMTLGDRIAVFNGGRIEQVGAPLSLYQQPANLFVAGFLGSPRMNFIPCRIERQGDTVHAQVAGSGSVSLPFAAATGEFVLGVRPEHLEPTDEGGLTAVTQAVEHLGDAVIVHALLAGSDTAVSLRLATAGAPRLAPGAPLRLKPQPSGLHLFERNGRALHAPAAEETVA